MPADDAPAPDDVPHASELIQLAQRAANEIALADGSVAKLDEAALITIPRHLNSVVGLYMRCRGLHRTIADHLLPARRATEAMILGRPLFEDSVLLHVMAAASEADRAGYAIDWALTRYTSEIDLTRQLGALGAAWDDTDLETTRQQCLDYARRHGIKRRPFGEVDARAKALGRLADLGAYRISHRYVHGSHVAMSARVRRLDESGVLLFGSADLDHGVLPIVAVWTTRSALIAFRSLAEIIGFDCPDSIRGLLDRCEQLQPDA